MLGAFLALAAVAPAIGSPVGSASSPNPFALADSLVEAASAHHHAGDLAAAARDLEHATSLLTGHGQTAFGPLASVTRELALVEALRGRIAESRLLLEEATELAARTVPHDPELSLRIEATRVSSAVGIGELGTAEQIARDALARALRELPDDHVVVGDLQNALGLVLLNENRNEEAEVALAEAVRIRSEAADERYAVESLANFGVALEGQMRVEEAHRVYLDVLERMRVSHGETSHAVAVLHGSLARVLNRQGRHDEAYPHSLECARIHEEVHASHPYTAWALQRVLEYPLKRLDRNPAGPVDLTPGLRALDIQLAQWGSLFDVSSENQVNVSSLEMDETVDLIQRAAAKAGTEEAARQAHTATTLRRGLILDRQRELFTAARDRPAVLSEYADAVGDLAAEVARALGRGDRDENPTVTSPYEQRARLARARERRETAYRSLLDAVRTVREASPRPRVDSQWVSRVLPAGSCWVEYVRHGGSVWGEDDRSDLDAAFVVLPATATSPRKCTLVPLGPAPETDALVGNVRQALLDVVRSGLAPSSRDEERLRRWFRALHERLWAPVRTVAGERDLYLIVPSAALQGVAFDCLVDETGRYLIETSVLHRVASARELADCLETPVPRQGLLAVSGPTAGAQIAGVLRGAGRGRANDGYRSAVLEEDCVAELVRDVVPLPHGELEVREITRLAKESGTRAQQLTGAAGSEAELRTRLEDDWRWVHFVAHGFFAGKCVADAVEWRNVDVASASSALELLGYDRMLASGLVLHPGTGDDDGVLLGSELATLNLEGCEWVVLSGCDTGLGSGFGLEGIYGFHRALRLAGVRCTILSLWPVSDEATRSLMVELYRQRLAGVPIARALRNAKRARMAAQQEEAGHRHPVDWAGFVAIGAWE